jgi:20S proteasome alpha/beta subunit
LAGYDVHDKEGEGSAALYYLDYMGTLHKVKYGSQGYASYFCMSTMDRDYVDGLKEEDALKIIHKCIHEIETRFLINQPNFIIKAVDKDGVRTISFGSDPADN